MSKPVAVPSSAPSVSRLDRRTGLSRRPMLVFVVGVLVAMAVVIVLAGMLLNAPPKDLIAFGIYLASTGALTLVVSYVLYRGGLTNWFRSLRWALLGAVLLTVALIFLNVLVTASLMFTNKHDLGLTTLLLVFAGICAAAFGYFIAYALTERIYKLAQGAEQLATGDLSVRVATEGNDELALLAASFNDMARRLQEADSQKRELEQARRDLIAWVSHDLRTPLTSIRVMIEAMTDQVVNDPATMSRYLTTAQTEIRHLSHLINDLMELAQWDAGRQDIHAEESSLRDLISDTLVAMRAHAERRGVVLTGDVEDGVDPVWMAPDKIQRVLNNLLDNAIRHTPSNGIVSVQACIVDNEARVAIRDTGPGISADDLPRIFERFYRGEKARGLDDQGERGVGLGLAIARGLVEAHGGRIWVESVVGQGALFCFTLPRHPR